MPSLEAILNLNPHVLSAVMFGRSRPQAGVLVDPSPGSKFDPTDATRLAEFRDAVWPTVAKMNAYAPQHSRILKQVKVMSNYVRFQTETALVYLR